MIAIFLAVAVQVSASGANDRCYASAGTQMALDECAARSAEAADSKLATFVHTYEARLSSEQLALFRSAQRDWQQFRQSSCKFEVSAVLGGSAYPEAFDECLAEKADLRRSELETLSNCKEGDYQCPSFKSGT